MLNVEYKLRLGRDEFVIKAEVKDEKQFFEEMSFYSSLPKTAPGGSDDLKLAFRTTTQGHKYYSLVSEKEQMEFKFGQNLENKGGGLFPKGWEPLFNANIQAETGGVGIQTAPAQAAIQPGVSVGIQTQAPPQQAPTQQVAQPVQTAPVQQQVVQAPQVQPVTPSPAAVGASNDVLARFGIGKK